MVKLKHFLKPIATLRTSEIGKSCDYNRLGPSNSPCAFNKHRTYGINGKRGIYTLFLK